jgi:predicted DNA-binding protein YlxM (UPF0122 family)
MNVDMDPPPEEANRQGRKAVTALRQTHEERWAEIAEETALTERQIAMWELAVRYDLKQMYVASEYGIRESTVSRHVERVREKKEEADEKIRELKTEIQQWEETKNYLDL